MERGMELSTALKERERFDVENLLLDLKHNFLRPMTTEQVQEWLKENAVCSTEKLKELLPHMSFDEEGPTGERRTNIGELRPNRPTAKNSSPHQRVTY